MNAHRDRNNVPTLVAASSADGVTVIEVTVDPSTHGMSVNDGATGSDHSDAPAVRDDNRVPVAMGVSDADGVTPVPLYADPADGSLLIKST